MTLDLLLLAVGLAFLMLGGETVVRGATGLARDVGVSPLVIGLTVVALGTSAPELAVNVIAVSQGAGAISFGNIVGSNMANIGLIVGCTALIRPIEIKGVVVTRELPMMLLATMATIAMGSDVFLRGRQEDVYDLEDGLLLLMFFLVFLYYTVGDFLQQRAGNGGNGLPVLVGEPAGSIWRHALLTIFGLAALIGGADVTVKAAVNVARTFGVPEEVIGLTVLAVGTSLPELVASLTAMLRGHAGLAIGNVVGSNIFNLLLVLGVTSLVGSVPVPSGGHRDLAVVFLFSLILLLVSRTGKRRIIRTEAVVLLLLYFGYLTLRSSQALGG
jgi:cation:H+ antiporter